MSKLSPLRVWGSYRDIECPNCQRYRVQDDGVCEKCLWDVDGNDYAAITRPETYNSQGYIFHAPENPFWEEVDRDEIDRNLQVMKCGLCKFNPVATSDGVITNLCTQCFGLAALGWEAASANKN